MRTFFRLAALLSLSGLVPACSILFDGAGYRSGTGTDAGPTDAGPRDTGPPMSCGSASECPTGQYCDLAATSTCLPGCDEDADCGGGDPCNTTSHRCEAPMPCTRDADCEPTEFCDDSDSTCYPCDEDGDRWADTFAPVSCNLRPAANIIGGGDCDDLDPAVHPYAAPDCIFATDDTCGTGMGVFSSAVFELGLVGLGDYAATPKPDTLEVVTLETTPMTARLLLVYRDASDLPRAAIVELGAGGPPTATPMDLMGWAPPGTLMSSQLAVVRDPAGGAYIGSLEISQEGTTTLVTKYAAHVERSGVFTPADGTTFRSNLAFTDRPTGVSSVIVSYDMVSGSAGAPHMAAIVTTDNGTGTLRDGFYLIGLRTGHFEESALFVPSPGRANRGVSGTAGALMVGASRSSLTWWNGGVGGRERFLAIDALSTHRSGAASGTDGGRSLGFTAAPTGGATISAYRVECDAASCSTGAATVLTTAADLGASGGGDALLSADHVGGPSFMVVGRSSMGLGGLVTTLVDLGSMVPTASSVVLPIGELGTANDIDIGIGLTSLPPSTTVLTVGFGMTTGDRVRFGAVRVCSSM